MAANFPGESGVDLVPRLGHDMTWSCDEHYEPIKFFCDSHKLALCHPCAFKDHQKPCKVINIGHAIKQLGRELEKKELEIAETKHNLQTFEDNIATCKENAHGHLDTLKEKVESTYEPKLQIEIEKEKKEALVINQEADDDIKAINEKRKERLRKSQEEAEQRKKAIKDYQFKLLKEIKEISDKVHDKVKELQQDSQSRLHAIQDSSDKIKRLLKDNKELVHNAHQVMASADETLRVKVRQDEVDRITHEVQCVKLVTGDVGGEFWGRLDGYLGKWELRDTINIPQSVANPKLVGHVGENGIAISHSMFGGDLYLTNLSAKETPKIIEGDKKRIFNSVATVNSNMTVCSMFMRGITGDSTSLDGCISLYDRQWKLIRDITIPRYTTDSLTAVYVDVDSDGMILAAEHVQSHIYVINPADGGIMNTITVMGKKVYGPICALSTGDIIMQTGYSQFTVISRSGAVKKVIQDSAWLYSSCNTDMSTDTLYITYQDREHGMWAVDQVSSDGVIQARRIVKYGDRGGFLFAKSRIIQSGKLVCQDRQQVFIYKKSFVILGA